MLKFSIVLLLLSSGFAFDESPKTERTTLTDNQILEYSKKKPSDPILEVEAIPEIGAKRLPKNCKEIQENGLKVSGIYQIQPKSSPESFKVFCDMETRGGGWTVIQNRFDGSEDFYRDWRDYKCGFGNLNREFWIGLEHIYHITDFGITELLVEITDNERVKAYAHYNRFAVGPEKDGYPLKDLGGFSGDAGDALTSHLNQKFSTRDKNNEPYESYCAVLCHGAWWYKACADSNINGKFIHSLSTITGQSMYWRNENKIWNQHHIFGSRMMVR